jgi:hypothetical protein
VSKDEEGDQKDNALRALSDPALTALREKLAEAGCVFDFAVYRLENGIDPSPALHRCALELLFADIRERWLVNHQEVIKKFPQYSASNSFQLDYDCSAAIPEVLPAEKVQSLFEDMTYSAGAPCLFLRFSDPPYGFRKDADAKGLFDQWCQILGLIPDHLPEVIDWVGDPDLEPSRSEWSNYFEAGKEWWGIWCLTIWNPVTRTLGVLAASATD